MWRELSIECRSPGLTLLSVLQQSMFWTYQMKYYEKLATRTSMLQGYAVATYVLLVVLCITALVMGAALLHYKRKNLSNEKALHTRLDWTEKIFLFKNKILFVWQFQMFSGTIIAGCRTWTRWRLGRQDRTIMRSNKSRIRYHLIITLYYYILYIYFLAEKIFRIK